MTCPDSKALREFLEGELADERLSPLNLHVDQCERCQESLERMTAVPPEVAPSSSLDTLTPLDDSSLQSLLSRLRDASPGGWQPTDDWSEEARQAIESLGQYVDIELLARGGSGLLFQARQPAQKRSVAIKIWPQRFLGEKDHAERVRREAEALARLSHPHVVQIFEVGACQDGSAFIVMELIDGDALSTLIRKGHAIPARRAATIVRELAAALAAVHAAGLVHRDIKPSNILLERSTSAAKLVDFGLVLDRDADTQLTHEGAIAGTPQYMSPEQIRDPHQVDARSDVYSLGVVLYELLTGSRPYRGVMRMVLFKVLNEDPTPPRKFDDSIPRDLETICLKAISKERHLRFAGAEEFASELQRWLDHRPIRTRRPSWLARLARWSRRNRGQAALIGAVLTLITVLAVGGPLASLKIARARDEAAQQRDIALQTLEKMVFEISERFDTDYLASSPAQQELLITAIDGLEQLASCLDDDFAVCRALAGAHVRLGGLLLQADGNWEDADLQLSKASELLVDLRTTHPNDFEIVTSESYLQWYRARMLLDQRPEEAGVDHGVGPSETASAFEHLRNTVKLDQRRLELKPRDPNVLHDATVSFEELGRVAIEHDLGVAKEAAERSIETAKRMLALDTHVCSENHEVAGLLVLVRVAAEREELGEARRIAAEAAALVDLDVEHYLSDEEAYADAVLDASQLLETYELLVDLAEEAGEPKEAARWLRWAIGLLHRIERAELAWQDERPLSEEFESQLRDLEAQDTPE